MSPAGRLCSQSIFAAQSCGVWHLHLEDNSLSTSSLTSSSVDSVLMLFLERNDPKAPVLFGPDFSGNVCEAGKSGDGGCRRSSLVLSGVYTNS